MGGKSSRGFGQGSLDLDSGPNALGDIVPRGALSQQFHLAIFEEGKEPIPGVRTRTLAVQDHAQMGAPKAGAAG
jgi:hypothetical protein